MREGDEEDCHFKPDGWERLTETGTCGEELHLLKEANVWTSGERHSGQRKQQVQRP